MIYRIVAAFMVSLFLWVSESQPLVWALAPTHQNYSQDDIRKASEKKKKNDKKNQNPQNAEGTKQETFLSSWEITKKRTWLALGILLSCGIVSVGVVGAALGFMHIGLAVAIMVIGVVGVALVIKFGSFPSYAKEKAKREQALQREESKKKAEREKKEKEEREAEEKRVREEAERKRLEEQAEKEREEAKKKQKDDADRVEKERQEQEQKDKAQQAEQQQREQGERKRAEQQEQVQEKRQASALKARQEAYRQLEQLWAEEHEDSLQRRVAQDWAIIQQQKQDHEALLRRKRALSLRLERLRREQEERELRFREDEDRFSETAFAQQEALPLQKKQFVVNRQEVLIDSVFSEVAVPQEQFQRLVGSGMPEDEARGAVFGELNRKQREKEKQDRVSAIKRVVISEHFQKADKVGLLHQEQEKRKKSEPLVLDPLMIPTADGSKIATPVVSTPVEALRQDAGTYDLQTRASVSDLLSPVVEMNARGSASAVFMFDNVPVEFIGPSAVKQAKGFIQSQVVAERAKKERYAELAAMRKASSSSLTKTTSSEENAPSPLSSIPEKSVESHTEWAISSDVTVFADANVSEDVVAKAKAWDESDPKLSSSIVAQLKTQGYQLKVVPALETRFKILPQQNTILVTQSYIDFMKGQWLQGGQVAFERSIRHEMWELKHIQEYKDLEMMKEGRGKFQAEAFMFSLSGLDEAALESVAKFERAWLNHVTEKVSYDARQLEGFEEIVKLVEGLSKDKTRVGILDLSTVEPSASVAKDLSTRIFTAFETARQA